MVGLGQTRTFFSQEKFVRAVARADRSGVRPLELRDPKSSANIFGLERLLTFNRRSVSFAPFGLCAFPNVVGEPTQCVSEFLRQLKTIRTIDFQWNVRFDHIELAEQLKNSGLGVTEDTTHVLWLAGDFEAQLRAFSATVRNKLRRSEGVRVRRGQTPNDVSTYYAIYKKLTEERAHWNCVYPIELFNELITLSDDVVLLLAEVDGISIAGGWFIRDGNSMRYWQGAMNYDFKRYFPHFVVIAYAIRLACGEAMKTFDMGASIGIASLEEFKSLWGTRKVPYWRFVWTNPLWASVPRGRRALRW